MAPPGKQPIGRFKIKPAAWWPAPLIQRLVRNNLAETNFNEIID
jgi:hypothetical protein